MSEYDDGYDEGYDDGCRETYEHDKYKPVAEAKADELMARFDYLKHGGEWQKVDECEAPSEYARGFLDAMRVLGLRGAKL